MIRTLRGVVVCLVLAIVGRGVCSVTAARGVQDSQTPSAPVILWNVSPRAVEYQLSRLSADELQRVERSVADAKYRPVFMALLSRGGVPNAVRDAALAALVTMDRTSRTRVLLEALGRVAAGDETTAARLHTVLLALPSAELRADREAIAAVLDARPAAPAFALRGAYPALLLAGDDVVSVVWSRAQPGEDHVVAFLLGLSRMPASPAADRVRAQLVPTMSALVSMAPDGPIGAAADDALVSVRPDAATLAQLSQQVTATGDPQMAAAAIRALARLPQSTWPQGAALEQLTRGVIGVVQATPAARRTQPATTDAIHFAESLTAALPDPARVTLRRELRALGVQVVRVGTIVEQMLFDLRWFVVEAGKPVQVVFTNIEAMPHNLVIGRPGGLQEIATLGAAVPPSTDPAVKAYVPASPLVLWSTHLLKEGETERLNFTAPATAGEYVFLCTFPGHAVRMYGVMKVVPDREAWEANPTVPIDPFTKMPFTSERH